MFHYSNQGAGIVAARPLGGCALFVGRESMNQSSTIVYDCNASLGRRHDRRVAYDTRADLRRIMSEAGISRALVYNPHGIHFGAVEGNQWLLEEIHGDPALIAQFVVNFATNELDEVHA